MFANMDYTSLPPKKDKGDPAPITGDRKEKPYVGILNVTQDKEFLRRVYGGTMKVTSLKPLKKKKVVPSAKKK